MSGKRLVRRVLAVGFMAAFSAVAEAQQVQEVDSTEIPPVANQAAVDATPCGFGRDLNENQTLINRALFSLHWCNALAGTWEGIASVSLVDTEIAFGDALGAITSSPRFTFDGLNLTLTAGGLTMSEITIPGNTAARTAQLFVDLVGGKVAICARFPTGAAVCSTELVEP